MLVFEFKVISYEYFMDSLKPWEVPTIMDNLIISRKDEWERTRIISFWTARPHYKKLNIKDVMTFEWEKPKGIKSEIKTTDEDIRQLRELFRTKEQKGS